MFGREENDNAARTPTPAREQRGMKLGLLTDIHEQVELLCIALDRFRHEQVDQVVVIGDVFEIGQRIEETCRLLAEAKAVGVWGNHDYGLCSNPSEQIRV